jgi:hypothetical protein
VASLAHAHSPGQLARALGELAVRVEAARVERRAVALDDYPGGARPSSILRLTGHDQTGSGENAAFSEAEHEAFAASVESWLVDAAKHGAVPVNAVIGGISRPYERAALEAALIDLALRQAGLSLYDLTGTRRASLRFVRSFAADPEPERVIQHLRDSGYSGDFKVDVDPGWQAGTLERLARDASIVIFDFKGRGDARLAQRLAASAPHALLEDPPSGFEALAGPADRARISRDANLLDPGRVAVALARGESANLKAPRMAGPLAVLRSLEQSFQLAAPPASESVSQKARPRVYIGGMFEIGVGRTQAQQLAALYCHDAPNDLAQNLNSHSKPSAPSSPPMLIRLDTPGFGSES